MAKNIDLMHEHELKEYPYTDGDKPKRLVLTSKENVKLVSMDEDEPGQE